MKTLIHTPLHFVPATKTVTSPIFLAAVTVFFVIGFNISLLCSATTSVLLNLLKIYKI